MEGRCATCKWWVPPTPPVLWGDCQQITECIDMNKPNLPRLQPAIVPQWEDHEYGPQTDLNLWTVADFGCVLWKPKELSGHAHGHEAG